MKFGKVEDVEGIDFNLPLDYEGNTVTANRVQATLYTGATSWNNVEWKGNLYPSGTKKANFLREYAQQFNSIELNATHYRTPSDKTIKTWLEESTEDFKFCPKILQAISHRHNMLENTELVNKFIVQLSKLGDKLGQCFLQLPPYFKHRNLPYLEQFLKAWPVEMPLAVELRDAELHARKDYFEEYLEILSRNDCTPLITDVAGRRDLLHMAFVNETVFVRWVGNGLHKSDFDRIRAWNSRLEMWAKKGVKNIYFMLHEPENLKTPEIAQYMAKELENIQYIEHRGPKLIEEQPNLFS